ncbi:MAG: hypothetical protein CME65_08765 [Halobacteriovoraceae bacterium]|nr:hypothetical protein [Halobacteriovoraceae bacterium]|tara:strand:+ start:617 stop:1459 length:843 start_codon:yes stop_codon:yes gene_type:complete
MERVTFPIRLKDETIDLFGLQLKHDKEKPWIIILPGLDDSILFYNRLFENLRKDLPNWNILALDLKGQGETLKQNTKIKDLKVPITYQASLVKKVLEEQQIENCFVIGLSYAGAVSLKVSIECRERVKGLGLIAPYVSNFKAFKKGLQGLYYHMLSKHPAKRAIAMMGLPFYFSLAKYENRLNQNILWDDMKLSALSKLTMGVLEFDTNEEIKKIDSIPKGIHLLCGFDDKVIPITAHKNLYHQIPDSIEKTFSLEENVGHRIFEEHPDVASHWISKIVS